MSHVHLVAVPQMTSRLRSLEISVNSVKFHFFFFFCSHGRRLKRLLEQEKSYQTRRDKDQCRRLEKVREELVKLKSFALMLVDERQRLVEQMDRQNQKIQDLSLKLRQAEHCLAAAKVDGQKMFKLETELEHKTTKFSQEHEEMTVKMAQQEVQGRQLRLQLVALSQKVEELEAKNKVLQKSEEDLQELRQKISRGECGSSSLVAELENLRKKVLEMEGKDEELTKTESQCQGLRRHLQEEEHRSQELTLEVDKLQKRMVELEKLEEMFSRTKKECSQVHTSLEKERHVVKDLAGELEAVKTRLKELESSESKMAKTQAVLKDDLLKMKSFTVVLVDERRTVAERLKREERKSEEMTKMIKTEQAKVTEVTEKLIEESKKLLKVQSEMELQVSALTQEKEELQRRLAREEDKRQELHLQLSRMGRGSEEELQRNKEVHGSPQEERKVEELTLEVERLKSRLKQLEVVEGDLMETEDRYDLLEKRFLTEQDKANALAELLEEVKSQVARNKGETFGPEAELRQRCQREEAKTRELQTDVQALKEKIHELMTKEDQLSQLQVDHAVLQQRLMQEDQVKNHMSQEVQSLTRELEATKCYSRARRPSSSGRRMVDVPVASRAVQTDAVPENRTEEEETTAGFIHKSVLEENDLMSNLRQRGPRIPKVLERFPPAAADLAARNSWVPWMRTKEALVPDRTSSTSSRTWSSSPQKPGRPLHIRVTPGPENTRATLEISGPGAEDFFSSTTIVPTLGLQKPRITIVPKTTAAAATAASKTQTCDAAGRPRRAKSPVTITTVSRTRSPESCGGPGSAGVRSPVSIITVSAAPVADACASPDPHDRTGPEKTPGPPASQRFCSNSSNIITTEDNRIHIHLGPRFKGSSDGRRGSVVTIKPGTLPRSPPQTSAGQSTKTSSLTITAVSSAASWSTQSGVRCWSDVFTVEGKVPEL